MREHESGKCIFGKWVFLKNQGLTPLSPREGKNDEEKATGARSPADWLNLPLLLSGGA